MKILLVLLASLVLAGGCQTGGSYRDNTSYDEHCLFVPIDNDICI